MSSITAKSAIVCIITAALLTACGQGSGTSDPASTERPAMARIGPMNNPPQFIDASGIAQALQQPLYPNVGLKVAAETAYLGGTPDAWLYEVSMFLTSKQRDKYLKHALDLHPYVVGSNFIVITRTPREAWLVQATIGGSIERMEVRAVPLTKKKTIEPTKKSLVKTSKTLVAPRDLTTKMKRHPTFKEWNLLPMKDAPKSWPLIDKERCVGPVWFVVDRKSRIVIQMATEMPDGGFPGWTTCENCMHRFEYCTCGRVLSNGHRRPGMLEPKVMRWMHRITMWQSGVSADETRNMPPPDYTPWINRNKDREPVDLSRFIRPSKTTKTPRKSLHGSTPNKTAKSLPSRTLRPEPLTAPSSTERQQAVAAATADIANMDITAIQRRASSRAKEVC